MKKIIVYSIVILLMSGCGIRLEDGMRVINAEEWSGGKVQYHGVSVSLPGGPEITWVDKLGKYSIGDTVWIMKK